MTIAIITASQIADYTKILQNVVLAGCGMATVWIAYSGLTTWRRELKGKSEYTKAKEILKAVYNVRLGFAVVRSPVIFESDYPAEMKDEQGNLKSEKRYDGLLAVYTARWKVLEEAFNELEKQSVDGEVEWGTDFKDVIIPLRKCRSELLFVVQLNVAARKPYAEPRKRTQKEREREDSVFYGLGGDPDPFTSEINAAIQKFEDKLRPHIKK